MNRINLIYIFFILFGSIQSQAQEINWLSWEEAMELNDKEPRKILVEVYIEKCGWCKKMDRTTFVDSSVISYVNANFYPVMLDAQMTEVVKSGGEVFKFKKSSKGGYHELAIELLNGRLSFPTTVFLDEKTKVIQPIRGYQNPSTFNQIVHYFNEDHYKRTPWKRYTQFFNTNNANSNLIHVGGGN